MFLYRIIKSVRRCHAFLVRIVHFHYICSGNSRKKGTRPFPSSFIQMTGEATIQAVEQMTNALIDSQPDLFLVEIRLKPTNNIKVFIDGDQGVSIERLVQVNRKLYKAIEESGLFPNGDFSLEVSSPGLDEPLKLHRQYLKNIGRFAEVTDTEGVKIEGRLLSVSDQSIVLEEVKGKGKKTETIQHNIAIDKIKTIKIQIKF